MSDHEREPLGAVVLAPFRRPGSLTPDRLSVETDGGPPSHPDQGAEP